MPRCRSLAVQELGWSDTGYSSLGHANLIAGVIGMAAGGALTIASDTGAASSSAPSSWRPRPPRWRSRRRFGRFAPRCMATRPVILVLDTLITIAFSRF
jgi:hypothetical protein